MPDIAIAPNPAAASLNGAVAAASASAEAGTAGAASGPLGAEAFAALLQKQLAGGTIDATAILLGAAETPAQSGSSDDGIAALLPRFLAALGLGLKGEGEPTGSRDASEDAGNDVPVLTDVFAPPAVPVTPAVLERTAAAGDAAPVSDPPARRTDAAANLAAAAMPESFAAALEADGGLASLSVDGQRADAAAMQAAAQAARAADGAAQAARPAQRIDAPVGSRAFGEALGERLTWMVGSQQSRADLVLNPPQLGRVEISLTVNGDQATALFVSANAAVRETLEASMPRLREILADAGVTLGQAQVGSESPQSPAEGREKGDNSRSQAGGLGASMMTDAAAGTRDAMWIRQGRGLVDTFA